MPVKRGDGKHEQLGKLTSTTVHVQCHKDYTRPSSIKAAKRKRESEEAATSSSPLKQRMRSSQSLFEFKNYCFICGNEADEEKEKRKAKGQRKTICHVSTLSFKDNIMVLAEIRGDDWGKTVKKRVMFDTDLVAAEAKYHQTCFSKFNLPVSEKKGRSSCL